LKRVCSIFSQILQLIPRDTFEGAVEKHQAERHARGFSSWGQLVAMLFCQLAQAKSLREITEGLQASEGKLKHLGLPEAPARSTLAYANSHRPWELFETVFQQLLTHCQKRLGVAKAGSKLGLPGKLLSLDATVIDLCASVFDWAHFRTTKGAVKLHLLLDHDGYLPCYAVITEGKVHEIQVARKLKLQRGAMLVFDRGYTDYGWFQQVTEEGVNFVTRLKDKAAYIVVERRPPTGAGCSRGRNHRAGKAGAVGDGSVSAAGALLGRGESAGTGVPDQSSGVGCQHRGCDLQGALANRTAVRELDMTHSFGCHGISRINCAESTVGGVTGWFRSAAHSSTSSLCRIQGAPTQACVAGNCFSRINRKTVVGVTPRTMAASLTDISLRACRSPSR
jgi:hypothetical protein